MAERKKENNFVDDYLEQMLDEIKMNDIEDRKKRQIQERRLQRDIESQDVRREQDMVEFERRLQNQANINDLRHQQNMERIQSRHEENMARQETQHEENMEQIRNEQRIRHERSRGRWERMMQNSDNRSQMIDELSDEAFVDTINNVRELYRAPEVYRERENSERERWDIQSEAIQPRDKEEETIISVQAEQDQETNQEYQLDEEEETIISVQAEQDQEINQEYQLDEKEREEWKKMLLGYARAVDEYLPKKSKIDEFISLSEEEWDIAIIKYMSMFGTIEKARESLNKHLSEGCVRDAGGKLGYTFSFYVGYPDKEGIFFKQGVQINSKIDLYSIRSLIDNELKLEDNGTEIVFKGSGKKKLLEGPQA